jgi:hypothetical protein
MITGAPSTSRHSSMRSGPGAMRSWTRAGRPDELVRVLTSASAGGGAFPDDVLAALPHMEQLVVHCEPIDLQSEAATAAQLEAVRSLGIELSPDDFGTGYSSLMKLRCYPIGDLRVNRSFVHGMLAHSEDAEIVLGQHPPGAAPRDPHRGRGVEEEEAEAEKLRSFGCELGQGYLWSRPLAPDAFAAWYRDRPASHPGVSRPPPQPGGAAADGRGGAWVRVPGRPVLRCKYCQASAAAPACERGDVEGNLKHHAGHLTGLRTTRRPPPSTNPECDG